MRVSSITLLAVLCGAALTVAPAGPTSATQINMNAAECQPFQPTNPQIIGHSEKGVFTLPTADDPVRIVICSVPRSPSVAGASGFFYVDGDNAAGASTTCILYSWSATLLLLGGTSFTTSITHYDMFLSFTAAQLDPHGFITLHCVLPPRGQGVLRGVTSYP